eukprot:1055045-Rhodomonas_salina.3
MLSELTFSKRFAESCFCHFLRNELRTHRICLQQLEELRRNALTSQNRDHCGGTLHRRKRGNKCDIANLALIPGGSACAFLRGLDRLQECATQALASAPVTLVPKDRQWHSHSSLSVVSKNIGRVRNVRMGKDGADWLRTGR